MSQSKQVFDIVARERGFKKTGSAVQGLSRKLMAFGGALLTTQTAYMLLQKAMESAQLAAKVQDLNTGFSNLTQTAGFTAGTLQKLRKATNGTVTDLELMKQANNALLLGIADSNDQMAEMFDVAQRLAKAMGQDAKFGIESLTTGLGRQSKLMLDNLGIIVDTQGAYEDYAIEIGKTADELDDAEKKQAFVNAALEQGKQKVAALGDEVLSASDKIGQFTTAQANLQAEMGKALLSAGLGEISTFATGMLNTWTLDLQLHNAGVLLASEAYNEMGLAAQLAFLQGTISAKEQAIALEENVTLSHVTANVMKKSLVESLKETIIQQATLGQVTGNTGNMMFNMASGLSNVLELAGIEIPNPLKNFTEDEEILSDEFWDDVSESWTQALNSMGDTEKVEKLRGEITALKEEMDKVSEARAKELQDLKDRNDALKSGNKTDQETLKLHKKQRESSVLAGASAKTVTEGLIATSQSYAKQKLREVALDNLSGIVKQLSFLGVFATPAAMAASSMFVNAATQLINNAGAGLIGGVQFEQGGLVGGRRHSQGGTMIEAEQGEYVMNRDAVESIGVDNLDRMNQGGGSQIIINNPIISSQYVEEELPELIAEAVRKGADFGVS